MDYHVGTGELPHQYRERISELPREVVPADEGAGERGEGSVVREVALVANDEPAVLIEPRVRPLDHPAIAP